jgi:diguanylate cyclase (GGDEF)-like protein
MSLAEPALMSSYSEDTLVNLKPATVLQLRRPVLVVLEGAEAQQSWVVERDNLIIGRDPACPVPLRDPTSSRRHARLWYSEPEEEGLPPTVRLQDLGSTNGTLVNGERLDDAPRMLREHDRIRIGATVLAFEYRDLREIQAEEALRRMAMTDALTGLFNRGVFDRELQREFDRCRRYGRPFSMVLFDLDHFKGINDTFGHPAGDRVLERVGRVVRQNIRDTDVGARYGGEEFGVILPETGPDGALQTAERLRTALAEMVVDAGGVALRVTASFGVATIDDEQPDCTAMLAACDRALYRAKDRGRNRSAQWKGSRT